MTFAIFGSNFTNLALDEQTLPHRIKSPCNLGASRGWWLFECVLTIITCARSSGKRNCIWAAQLSLPICRRAAWFMNYCHQRVHSACGCSRQIIFRSGNSPWPLRPADGHVMNLSRKIVHAVAPLCFCPLIAALQLSINNCRRSPSKQIFR